MFGSNLEKLVMRILRIRTGFHANTIRIRADSVWLIMTTEKFVLTGKFHIANVACCCDTFSFGSFMTIWIQEAFNKADPDHWIFNKKIL